MPRPHMPRESCPTPMQTDFLMILFNDTAHTTHKHREACMSEFTGRTVHFIDELTKFEAIDLIAHLKTLRGDND